MMLNGSCDPLQLIDLRDVELKPVRWLWRGYIAKGKVNLIAGDPGLGKSQMVLQIVARLTRGTHLPRDCMAPPVNVLLLCSEDDAGDTIKPRLEAANADLRRIRMVESIVQENGKKRWLDLDKDLERLETTLTKFRPTLIVMDALSSYTGKIDRNAENEVRVILDRLGKFASEHDVALLGICHLKKSAEADPKRALSGSLAWIAAARCAAIVTQDPDDDGRRLLLSAKCNIGPEPPGVGFSIQPMSVGPCETSCAIFDDRPVDVNARQAFARIAGADRGSTKLDEATDWLEEVLAAGPMPTDDVQAAANAKGISSGTLRRAKKELRIKPEKSSGTGPWTWQLPEG